MRLFSKFKRLNLRRIRVKLRFRYQLKFMRQRFFPAIILFAMCFGVFTTIKAQEKSDAESINIETTLVSVPVIVSDRQGRYVAGLQAKDFTLFQDGAKQNIDFFAATEEPLNVALLIDTSRSTQSVIGNIKRAATEFVEQLKPQDKAIIVSFDYEPHVLSALTSDVKNLKQAIKRAEIGEYIGTALRDAIVQITEKSFANVKGRKAIILLTDGKDHGSYSTTDELIHSVEESDTMIYSIFYQTGRGFNQNPRDIWRNDRRDFPFPPRRQGGVFNRRFPDDNPFPRRFPNENRRRQRAGENNEAAADFLKNLADATAGRFYESEITDLKKTFGLITDELRFQYRLGFYPNENTEVNALHQLRVKVLREGVAVRARASFRVKQ